MAFAAETQDTGFTSSESSLKGPHTKKCLKVSSSYPIVKPSMSVEPNEVLVKIVKTAEKIGRQGFNKLVSTYQKENVMSLDDSKQIIRELATELNRIIQFKKISQMFGKIKNKGTEEEQQYYILHWAEELETLKRKQTEIELLKEEKPETQVCSVDTDMKWKKAKSILSDWFWKLKEMKENSVCPKEENKETLRDLYKQSKQRESSILPVMDWMMWTVLQSENTEDFSPELWMKKKQRSKNTVGLRIPNTVWNWISKSAAIVVLDPNTANPDLIVSEDGKSVKASNHSNNWLGFRRERMKYDGWICVQAKESYNTGRHYWEVDVSKKCEWRVGVVKESAPRHGYATMNTKTGYWNLRLQLGTLFVLTEPVTKLYLPTPSKIGIYLDIEEGQVSFYDAEKRRHIYTFNTDFSGTESIYPMFGTIETDRALVIS